MGPVESSSTTTITHRGVRAPLGADPDRTVVSLRGEFDVYAVDDLLETMADAAACNDADLVLDMRAVEFIEAVTVGAVVQVHNLLRRESRSLVVRNASGCALRIFDLCSLGHLLERRGAGGDDLRPPAHALASWVAVRAATPDSAAPSSAPPARRVPSADGHTARDRETAPARRQGP